MPPDVRARGPRTRQARARGGRVLQLARVGIGRQTRRNGIKKTSAGLCWHSIGCQKGPARLGWKRTNTRRGLQRCFAVSSVSNRRRRRGGRRRHELGRRRKRRHGHTHKHKQRCRQRRGRVRRCTHKHKHRPAQWPQPHLPRPCQHGAAQRHLCPRPRHALPAGDRSSRQLMALWRRQRVKAVASCRAARHLWLHAV